MDSLRVHALRRAVAACGGVSSFAARVGAPEALVDAMLSGREPVAVEVFMASVDIVTQHDLEGLHARVGDGSKPPQPSDQ